MGIDDFDSPAAHVFLQELKKKYPDVPVVVVWDNAPCHRPKIHRQIPGVIILFLPPYSPELNPAERFFEEVRKGTANDIFKTIEEQNQVIESTVNELVNDPSALQRLVGYQWILEQCV